MSTGTPRDPRCRGGDARWQHDLTPADRPDRPDNLSGRLFLERVASSPRAQCLVDDRFWAVWREEQHPCSWYDAPQLPRQRDAVAIGQVKVGDHHIRSERNGQLACLETIAALGDHGQVVSLRRASQRGAQAHPENL
jgi:hypothetical protein